MLSKSVHWFIHQVHWFESLCFAPQIIHRRFERNGLQRVTNVARFCAISVVLQYQTLPDDRIVILLFWNEIEYLFSYSHRLLNNIIFLNSLRSDIVPTRQMRLIRGSGQANCHHADETGQTVKRTRPSHPQYLEVWLITSNNSPAAMLAVTSHTGNTQSLQVKESWYSWRCLEAMWEKMLVVHWKEVGARNGSRPNSSSSGDCLYYRSGCYIPRAVGGAGGICWIRRQ